MSLIFKEQDEDKDCKPTSLNGALDILSSLMEVKNEDQLLDQLNRFAKIRGFDKFLVGMQWHGSQGEMKYRVLSGYPIPWQQRYLERGYLGLDPTVTHCQTSEKSLVWSDLLFINTQSMEILEEARHYGLGYGISIPIHEMHGIKSMVSLARDKPFESKAEEIESLSAGKLLASCAHFAYRRLLQDGMREQLEQNLTAKELECLRWVALGKTAYEISRILNISEATVAAHARGFMNKLDVRSRPQAVAIAFRLGLIN